MDLTLSGISVTAVTGGFPGNRSLLSLNDCSVTDIGHYSDRTYVLRSLTKCLMAFKDSDRSDSNPRKFPYTCACGESLGKRSLRSLRSLSRSQGLSGKSVTAVTAGEIRA